MKKYRKQLAFILMVIFFLYFAFLLRPSFSGEFNGTFDRSEVPIEYIKLKEHLIKDDKFFRVLWLPTVPHYGYFSEIHRAISAQELFHTYDHDALIKALNNKLTEQVVQEAGVRYVIIPFDSEQHIYLHNRNYDETLYRNFVSIADKIVWLKKSMVFGKIIVYEVSNTKDHFWSPSERIKISYTYHNPTFYTVSIKNAKKGDMLIFSESFDSYWYAQINNSKEIIESKKYHDRFNSFVLPKEGDYTLAVKYKPQEWVNVGVVISLISLAGIIGILIVKRKS